MSDINIQFDWYVFPLIAVMFGWPGLLIGGIAGGYLWRRHRVIRIWSGRPDQPQLSAAPPIVDVG